MKINEFIKKRPELFWYVKDYDSLSKEAIVAAVLNYGSWNDFMNLVKILGIMDIAEIFRKQTSGFRTNYSKKAKNYFNLYFKKYAR